MKQAGDIADRTVGGIEQRFSRLNPSVGASFLGNLFSTAVTKGIGAAEDHGAICVPSSGTPSDDRIIQAN